MHVISTRFTWRARSSQLLEDLESLKLKEARVAPRP